MSLAIGWDTPDGAPTMTTYLLVAFVSLLAAVAVLLTLWRRERRDRQRERQRDREQLLRERVPYTQMVEQNREQLREIRAYLVRGWDDHRPELTVYQGGKR